MNETLLFILNLRETLSGGMANIARTAASVFTGVDKRVANTQKQMSMAGRSATDLNNRISLLTQKRDLAVGTGDIVKANREIEQLERRLDKVQNMGRRGSTSSPVRGMKMPWWLSGAMIGGMALAGTMSMIKVGADQQRDVTGLSTFMGKDKAQKYYDQVQQDARVTPFVTHDLMAANRMLISTGMNADRARGDIMNLANAVAATGGSNYALERMAQHLQMIRGMGHASYMQLKEFTTNGINIMQLLSDATGKHIKMTHGMTVSYKAIENALAHAAEKGGLFYNALFAQSQTIWGKWSTLVDDLQLSAGKIVQGQSNAITGLLDLFDKYAERLPAMAEQWGGAITNIAEGIIHLVGTVIDLSKWVYHHWTLVKGVIITFYSLKAVIWAVQGITAIYNGVMAIAAWRTMALAAAEAEATVASGLLGAALTALPWVAVGAAAFLAGSAIADMLNKSRLATEEITKQNTARNENTHAEHIRKITNIEENNAKIEASKNTPAARHARYIADHPNSKYAVHQETTIPKTFHLLKEPSILEGNNTTSVALKSKNIAKDKEEKEEGDEGGSITGGGSRKIILNVHKGAIDIKNYVKDMAQALDVTEEKMDELLLRWLQSARAAM